MNRIITGIGVLLLTVFTMAGLPPRALSGSGIITDKGNGRVVNLTVYFDDKGQDRQQWIANFQAYIDVVTTYGMDQVFEAVIENDGEVTSDHAPFWDLMADCMKRDPLAPCYPAAWIIEYAEEGFLNPKMHNRNDRVNIMNLPYYTAVVKAALGTAAHLAETMD